MLSSDMKSEQQCVC